MIAFVPRCIFACLTLSVVSQSALCGSPSLRCAVCTANSRKHVQHRPQVCVAAPCECSWVSLRATSTRGDMDAAPIPRRGGEGGGGFFLKPTFLSQMLQNMNPTVCWLHFHKLRVPPCVHTSTALADGRPFSTQ